MWEGTGLKLHRSEGEVWHGSGPNVEEVAFDGVDGDRADRLGAGSRFSFAPVILSP